MKAGLMNCRVTIQQKTAGQDSSGQPSLIWMDYLVLWASIKTTSGLTHIKSNAEISSVKYSIRIRYRDDIDAGMRVTYGAKVYDIKAVLPDMKRNLYIDLICETGASDG